MLNIAKFINSRRLQTVRRWLEQVRQERGLRHESRLRIGKTELQVPKGHILHRLAHEQPFRDRNIGIIAKFLYREAPTSCVLDIGANIGDTGARIFEYSNIAIHCIEPHPIFYKYLADNSKAIPTIKSIRQAYIGSGGAHTGRLEVRHNSTARFSHDATNVTVDTLTIDELGIDDIGLVKCDTDGFDFIIINSHLDWLQEHQPLLFYENEVRDQTDEATSNQIFQDLYDRGYRRFVVFDDPGYYLTCTKDLQVMRSLNRYLLETWRNDKPKRLFNYDILAMPETRANLYQSIVDYYLA
jgi:FkbM family methyltransferase